MSPQIIALISTDLSLRTLFEQALSSQSFTLVPATTPEAAHRLLTRRKDLNLIVCDESSAHIERKPVLIHAGNFVPPVPVIVLGQSDSAKAAIEALREGAIDYIPKPLTVEALRSAFLHAQAFQTPITSSMEDDTPCFEQIISVSPQMRLVKHLAAEVAMTDATVLITGESGTGKELFAHAIHAASLRAQGPFVALNCAGIPEQLLESELFGYQRGAFTDAKQAKPGRFQMAEKGTLFLDEIGEMSPMAQGKLLRVLEDHIVDPLGDTQSIKVDIRVIAATNEDLPAQIKAGRFRLDLYYRLNVYQLRIPPLRERPEDVEPILRSFLDKIRLQHGHVIGEISPDALVLLQQHDWPGNVRELHNVAEGLTITCKEKTIRPEHLPQTISKSMRGSESERSGENPSLLDFGLSLEEIEKRMLKEALYKSGGNISKASRLLKMTRNTFRYRMAKHHLQ